MTTKHPVTVEHLRHLATTCRNSLFADCGTLVDTEDGIITVPFRVVTAALSGESKLASCRLLYDRSMFIEDGIITGPRPKTVDGSDLDARLAIIAAGINDQQGDQ